MCRKAGNKVLQIQHIIAQKNEKEGLKLSLFITVEKEIMIIRNKMLQCQYSRQWVQPQINLIEIEGK